MKLSFTVMGEPVGKGRPQFSTYGGRITARTPKKTAMYENLVKLAYQQQCKNTRFEGGVPLRAEIAAYYSIPTSKSRKQQAGMVAGTVRPTKKPDTDNICKVVLDSLNGIAYHDDSQVVDVFVSKWYSTIPRVEIVIEEVIAKNSL